MEACQQGQVDHCRGHQHLEARLSSAQVACLAEPPLDESGDSVFDNLAPALILPKWRAVLQGTSLL